MLVVPLPLASQAGTTVSTYVGAGSGIADVPVLVGGALSSDMNLLGLRLAVGVDARDTPLGGMVGDGISRSAWGADLDLTVSGRHVARFLTPYYVSAGTGVRSWSEEGGAAFSPVASVGAGYRRDLLGRLGLEAEARYRAALGANGAARPTGAEFRVGLSVRLHGGGDRAAPRPAVRSAGAVPAPRRAPSAAPAAARLAFTEADRYLGTPYLWGGSSPDKGFDCSGFVQYLFRKQGIELPRVSRDQARAGVAVPTEVGQLREGDLLLFASNGSWIDHVAIYAGDGWILHASSSGGGVRYDQLAGPRGDWYMRKMVAARRVLGST